MTQFSAEFAKKLYVISYENKFFNKPPVMHVEIHNALISEQWKSFRKYYSDPFKCGRPQKEKRFVYEMTDEEFYIYFLVHLYKHYSNGGTGIRSVMDCFMINKNLISKLDWTYINKKHEQLELTIAMQ